MDNCIFCGDSCSCGSNHGVDICDFCESHTQCEICGAVTCQPFTLTNDSDGDKIQVCERCTEIESGED